MRILMQRLVLNLTRTVGGHLGGCRGAAIPGEGHARQPLQVSDAGGVTGIHQGQVAALHHCCHASLFTACILLGGPALLTYWPGLSNALLQVWSNQGQQLHMTKAALSSDLASGLS